MDILKIKNNNILSNDLNHLIFKYKPTYIVLDCDGTLYPNILEARRIFNDLLLNFFYEKFGYTNIKTNKFISENKIKFNTESEIAACILGGISNKDFEEGVIELMQLDSIGIKNSLIWTDLLKHNIPLIIFTNNSSKFAHRVSKEIGISDKVECIFGEVELGFLRKPDLNAYKIVSDYLGHNERVLYFDDDVKCLDSGKKIGWTTILTVFEDTIIKSSKTNEILKK